MPPETNLELIAYQIRELQRESAAHTAAQKETNDKLDRIATDLAVQKSQTKSAAYWISLVISAIVSVFVAGVNPWRGGK